MLGYFLTDTVSILHMERVLEMDWVQKNNDPLFIIRIQESGQQSCLFYSFMKLGISPEKMQK